MLVSIWWYVCFRVVLVSIWLHVSVFVYCWIAFGGIRFSRALLVNTLLQLMLSCCVLYYLAHSQNCTFRRMRTSESVAFVSVLVEIKSLVHTCFLKNIWNIKGQKLNDVIGLVAVFLWLHLGDLVCEVNWALFFVLLCCCWEDEMRNVIKQVHLLLRSLSLCCCVASTVVEICSEVGVCLPDKKMIISSSFRSIF